MLMYRNSRGLINLIPVKISSVILVHYKCDLSKDRKMIKPEYLYSKLNRKMISGFNNYLPQIEK